MGERCYERHGRCYVLNIRWNLDQLQPYTILCFIAICKCFCTEIAV